MTGVGLVNMVSKICTIHGCGRPLSCKFLCSKHYHRLRTTGTTYEKDPRLVEAYERFKLRNRTLSGSEKLYGRYQAGAKVRGLQFEISLHYFYLMVIEDCFYCGSPPSQTTSDFLHNGLDRVDSSLGYIEGNCVPACKTCNFAKNNMTLEAFVAWAARVENHLSRYG